MVYVKRFKKMEATLGVWLTPLTYPKIACILGFFYAVSILAEVGIARQSLGLQVLYHDMNYKLWTFAWILGFLLYFKWRQAKEMND